MLSTITRDFKQVPTPNAILTLTQGVALSDHACFDALHSQWNPIVRLWIASTIPRSMREAHASDIEQEVWLRVIRKLRPMDCPLRFERWLRAVTLNAARDRIRQEIRRTKRQRSHARSRQHAHSSSEAQHTLLLAEQRAQAIQALRTIDAATAQLIDLRMRTDATLDRLSSIVGLTPGSIDGKIRRALRALKSQPAAPSPEPASPEQTKPPNSSASPNPPHLSQSIAPAESLPLSVLPSTKHAVSPQRMKS